MTGIVAIDESGDLGKNGTRFFVMAAIMSNRSRNLLPVSKVIVNLGREEKYKNTPHDKITMLLNLLSKSNVVITYIVVDKHDFNTAYYNVYGNKLYHMALDHLLESISATAPVREVSILLDRTSSISEMELEDKCHSLDGIRVRKCTKFNSSSNKCLQIADYVAGAIWHMYERNEYEHYTIIRENIRCP